MTKTRLILVLACAAVAAAAGSAVAGSSPQTGSFNVTATVVQSCRITASPDLAFGNYDPADVNNTTPLDSTSSISVRCTRGTAGRVELGQGANPAAGSTAAVPLRQMAAGSARLRYDIHTDGSRATMWGAGVDNDVDFTSASSNTATTLTTFGRIPAGQDVPAGDYRDSVVVTVRF